MNPDEPAAMTAYFSAVATAETSATMAARKAMD